MSKKQKVWFWVGLGLFVVPEVLWSPSINYIYEFFQAGGNTASLRTNYFTDPRNINWYSTLLFMQLVGTLVAAINLRIGNKPNGNLVRIFLFVTALIIFFSFLMSIVLRNIGF